MYPILEMHLLRLRSKHIETEKNGGRNSFCLLLVDEDMEQITMPPSEIMLGRVD